MTMHRELLVDFSELAHLSIPCRKCKTRVLLDCSDPESRVPAECPSCGADYDESFRDALNTFRHVYRKLSDPKGREVQVRIASPVYAGPTDTA